MKQTHRIRVIRIVIGFNNCNELIFLFQHSIHYASSLSTWPQIRDYIHVMDLADGHIAALRKLFATDDIGCAAYNLGTGSGTSVLEMVAAFEKASGKVLY